ncbi:hypothetical protein BH11PLA1_BH11PLA1_07240 [soil metagenome]
MLCTALIAISTSTTPPSQMGWWVSDAVRAYGGPGFVVAWCAWVVVSICLHELAHGYAAIRLGDDTPIRTGHMTWNPIVHMGMTSLILFAAVGIAFGAMPVDTSRLRGRYGETIVAAAGPAMNLLLALLCVVVIGVTGALARADRLADPTAKSILLFFLAGGSLNVALLFYNLLPIPPLDGWRIAGGFYRPMREWGRGPNALLGALTAFFLVSMVLGGRLFEWSNDAVIWGAKPVMSVVEKMIGPGEAEGFPASQRIIAPTPSGRVPEREDGVE